MFRFKAFNRATKLTPFPMSRMDEMNDRLSAVHWFNKIDLRAG